VPLEDLDEVVEHPEIYRYLRIDFFDEVGLVFDRDVEAKNFGIRERTNIQSVSMGVILGRYDRHLKKSWRELAIFMASMTLLNPSAARTALPFSSIQ
jgi:hypothetical protein